ncbi:ABC transporter ATP-binding protein [Xylanibacillus composti]|nr:ABC transporter ATP-binding protein [Xylanibacillus composti]
MEPAGPAAVKVQFEGIVKTFQEGGRQTRVLDGIDLHAREGEFVSILGPSGSGKSTLFLLLGGLYRPDQGRIVLDGRDISGERGLVSYMPQDSAMFPWRTVEQNAALPLQLDGVPARKALATARDALQKAGLNGYEKALPHQLSGGMQQRVAFVRALLGARDVMCLDEPFAALDALTRQEMQHWLLRQWEQERRTVLFVTHSIEEALYLSDRLYVLSAKPTRVLQEIEVPFPRPRDQRLLLDPAFAALRGELYELLLSAKEQEESRHD